MEGQIEIIEGHPALYLGDENALCIADLHLGYEEALAESSGIALPSRQLKDVEHALEVSIARCSSPPSTLIINGDLKHVFSESSVQEWKEVPMFIEFALDLLEEIILVRGNHDTFLGPLKRFGQAIKIVNTLRRGEVLFLHGHTKDFASIIRGEEQGAKTIVIAHEHPFLVLGDRVGARVRLPCFLKGKLKLYDGNVLVMPAFSPLAGGTPVNVASKEDFLSPLLKSPEVEIDEMAVYAVDEEIGILEFPALRKWKVVCVAVFVSDTFRK